ncbi:MAG: hypothetical protein KVP17_004026 [Porospora cf. gigantea B]|uniref:uncharacterized protein n=1 Tax=Porospora cf. gigantea B TaxID=2853592 RepID=UPI0035719FE2|nr:MAG: hypothetical protein KVP17_004026 [Porospora cf. gigantea B]
MQAAPETVSDFEDVLRLAFQMEKNARHKLVTEALGLQQDYENLVNEIDIEMRETVESASFRSGTVQVEGEGEVSDQHPHVPGFFRTHPASAFC